MGILLNKWVRHNQILPTFPQAPLIEGLPPVLMCLWSSPVPWMALCCQSLRLTRNPLLHLCCPGAKALSEGFSLSKIICHLQIIY